MSGNVNLSGVGFGWPDGDRVLSGVDVAWTDSGSGLIGTNGSGKTALLRLITGELAPTEGTIQVTGRVAALPQTIATVDRRTVGDLLQISAVRAATERALAGRAAPADLDLSAADWQLEDRALAELARVGVPTSSGILDRPLDTLSGGQATMIGIAATLLRPVEITILDEPTNNLDLTSVEQLTTALAGYRGALVVAGHDHDLFDTIGITRRRHLSGAPDRLELDDRPVG